MARSCVKKQIINGVPTNCGKCDYCTGRRINDWTARCMMEKATAPFTYVVTLTYNEETDFNADGGKAFRYADVVDWKRRIRDQPGYDDGVDFLRALAAGERGDRHNRTHWHVPLFSSVDIVTLGEWSAPWGVVTDRAHIVTGEGEKAKRCSWSLWPHGFVVVQEPDYGGMRYAVSYAVKDAFDLDNSIGTAREAKCEFGATSKFRPKAETPIGATFAIDHLRQLAAIWAVDPKPSLAIPGRKYPWYASGIIRQVLLDGYRQINEAFRAAEGGDCAGWSTLVYGSRDSQGDLLALGLVEREEEIPPELAQDAAYVAIGSGRGRTRDRFKATVRRRCGSTLPCRQCLLGMGDAARAEMGVISLQDETLVSASDFLRLGGENLDGDCRNTPEASSWLSAAEAVRRLQWDGGGGAGVHPRCQLRGSAFASGVFPLSDAAARSSRVAQERAEAVDSGPVLAGHQYARRHKTGLR